MTDKTRVNIRDTTKILKQLDMQSLLLVDSGARLLLARQRMDEESTDKGRKLQEAVT